MLVSRSQDKATGDERKAQDDDEIFRKALSSQPLPCSLLAVLACQVQDQLLDLLSISLLSVSLSEDLSRPALTVMSSFVHPHVSSHSSLLRSSNFSLLRFQTHICMPVVITCQNFLPFIFLSNFDVFFFLISRLLLSTSFMFLLSHQVAVHPSSIVQRLLVLMPPCRRK